MMSMAGGGRRAAGVGMGGARVRVGGRRAAGVGMGGARVRVGGRRAAGVVVHLPLHRQAVAVGMGCRPRGGSSWSCAVGGRLAPR